MLISLFFLISFDCLFIKLINVVVGFGIIFILLGLNFVFKVVFCVFFIWFVLNDVGIVIVICCIGFLLRLSLIVFLYIFKIFVVILIGVNVLFLMWKIMDVFMYCLLFDMVLFGWYCFMCFVFLFIIIFLLKFKKSIEGKIFFWIELLYLLSWVIFIICGLMLFFVFFLV